MRNFFAILGTLCVFILSSFPHLVEAGFGITPPYVRNTSLTRNSVYEQNILLVRSDPSTPLKATILVDAPEIAEWIEIVEGESFLLPADVQKVPMTVRVTVPDDADFTQYKGKIRIRTGAPDDGVNSGAVNISLGAQVDVDLTVIDKEIFDFRVRKIGVSELNEGHKVGWLYFPGKINFSMLIENTGNVPVSPDEVLFRIYNKTGAVLLEETVHTNKIDKVDPFMTETVVAELPTRLPAGAYIARYEIKNVGDEVKQDGEISLNILPYGTLQGAGYGFIGLSLPHKLSIILPIILFIIICIVTVHTIRRKRKE